MIAVVNLRGLTLVGGGAGTVGIQLTSGSLNIQNCLIRGFSGRGMALVPAGPAAISIVNTVVSDKGGDGLANQTGVGTQGTAMMFIAGVTVLSNSTSGYQMENSGTIEAFQNNRIADGNNTGTLTAIAQQ